MLLNPYRFASGATDPYWANVVASVPMDGVDGSTTFTDQKSGSWFTGGNAKLDDGASVFGTTSGLFDGSGDYIAKAYALLKSADFTVEGFFQLNGLGKTQILFTTYLTPSQTNTIILRVSASNRLSSSNGVVNDSGASTTLTTGVWYYAALVYTHSTTTWKTYLSTLVGTPAVETTTVGAVSQSAPNIYFGGSPLDNNIGTHWLDGRLANWRVTNGVARSISAVPVAPFPNS